METAAADQEYTFRPLAVVERVQKENWTQVLLIARLVPANASQKPRVYMIWLENDFTGWQNQSRFWGGIPMWLSLHLQAVIKENGTVKITFPSQLYEQDENDVQWDAYTYAPRWINGAKEIKIVNKDDASNYLELPLYRRTRRHR